MALFRMADGTIYLQAKAFRGELPVAGEGQGPGEPSRGDGRTPPGSAPVHGGSHAPAGGAAPDPREPAGAARAGWTNPALLGAGATIVGAVITALISGLFAAGGGNPRNSAGGQTFPQDPPRITTPFTTASSPFPAVGAGQDPGATTAPPQGGGTDPRGPGYRSTAAPGTARTAAPNPTTAAPSPAEKGGQWSGTLVLGTLEGGEKDLDVRPPARVGTEEDNDLYITVSSPATLYALGGAGVAEGPDSGPPATAADCANAIASAASDGVPMTRGTVICALTGEGRIARLTVTATPGGGRATATFDAIIWPAP